MFHKGIVLFIIPLALAMTAQAAGAKGMKRTVTRSHVAGAYRLVLKIGPAEKMGPKAEKPLGGHMATCRMGMQAMATRDHMRRARCNHHVELHVFTRATGKVVTKASVSIRLHCRSMNMSHKVPIMTMMGADVGMKDFHYGNNVRLMAATYNVSVTVNHVHTVFHKVHLS